KGAEVLYICWRASGKGALADNFYYEGTAHCFVDHKTCTVARAQMGNQTFGGEVEVHAPTGLPLKGLHIPELEAAQAAACELHDMFPEHGIIGWDVALTPRGPLFVEANHNPIHGTYQITADRGFLNEEFKPRLDALKALQAERVRVMTESSAKINKSMLRNALVGMRLAKPKT
ncbi:MAG: sugar-transfer associated ATP-grasp domain-containing protein, partial [Deltaproteobacteria bacterium]